VVTAGAQDGTGAMRQREESGGGDPLSDESPYPDKQSPGLGPLVRRLNAARTHLDAAGIVE